VTLGILRRIETCAIRDAMYTVTSAAGKLSAKKNGYVRRRTLRDALDDERAASGGFAGCSDEDLYNIDLEVLGVLQHVPPGGVFVVFSRVEMAMLLAAVGYGSERVFESGAGYTQRQRRAFAAACNRLIAAAESDVPAYRDDAVYRKNASEKKSYARDIARSARSGVNGDSNE
jgi:hypothetical protein